MKKILALLLARLMVSENRLEHAAKAEKAHGKDLEDAQEAVEAVESDGDAENAQAALEEVAEVHAELKSHYEKVAEVKTAILARQQARMSAEQFADLQEDFVRIMEIARTVDERIVEKRENVKVKYKVLSEQTDEEVEEVETEIESRIREAQGRAEERMKVKVRVNG